VHCAVQTVRKEELRRTSGVSLVASTFWTMIRGILRRGHLKWYGKREGILDIDPAGIPDYYPVLPGPKASAAPSRGTTRPWLIESGSLFHGPDTVLNLRTRGVKIGVASSVLASDWDEAELYPRSNPSLLALSDEQRKLLALFSKEASEGLSGRGVS